MAIDEKILEKLKKLDDKKKIKKLLERLPDIDPERFKDLERFKDKKEKKEKIPDDFFKFKEKKKRKDFFMEPMPLPYDPNKKIPNLRETPYKLKPSDKMPGIQLLKKGGMVKGYKAGGQVKKDKSPNSGMITKRGWGASRKT
jgi:hypothetical protein